MKKYFLTILFSLLIATNVAFAQIPDLIPCAGTIESPCGFPEVMVLINNIITAILSYFILPIAIAVFVYGGFLYMTSGSNPGKRTRANAMFRKLLIGLFFCLAAWAIVKIILTTFGYNDTTFSPIVGTLLLYT
ncbi:MAG: Type secretion system pilin [Candidatus Parcubacteria bacterium]|jgi:hypothetical protein